MNRRGLLKTIGGAIAGALWPWGAKAEPTTNVTTEYDPMFIWDGDAKWTVSIHQMPQDSDFFIGLAESKET